MINPPAPIAEAVKNEKPNEEPAVPGVRGKQTPEQDSEPKGTEESPTNWARFNDKAPLNPIKGDQNGAKI